ncbi:MAG: NAD(P)-binding domain-containing protein [Lewinellaceae bacterium]|nr:NAD(P)-binding domain-containing protein [Phaeodactylibacter sp.]MCB9040603.1 NAD(P)-binding domain-containing protein [Lewinellaceae bacterium]
MTANYDYIVIGAGPAGLQLGYYLQKMGFSYIILERNDKAGTFFEQYPRHRRLISINKIYTGYDDKSINLRWDWNSLLCDHDGLLFKNYSKEYLPNADILVDYLNDFSSHYKLNISFQTEVANISKEESRFVVKDKEANSYYGKRLIVATGMFKPYIPDIKGAELVEDNYTNVSADPMDFCGQRVLILGKGNSAFELADTLIPTTALIHLASPEPVKMAWKTHYVGHLRAINNNFLETYLLKGQNALINGQVTKIEKIDGVYRVSIAYNLANEEVEQLYYDRIIFTTGFQFDDSIFDASCKPELTIKDRFPNQTSEWESTNVKDMYFAGVLMHMRDFKKKQSGFIHGFRYNIAALCKMFGQKYHRQPLPCEKLPLTAKAITDKIIERVNRSSSLWQQTGYLGDYLALDHEKKEARYYEGLPVDYMEDSQLAHESNWYAVTLEFGQEIIDRSPDVFAVERIHKDDYPNAKESTGIHPIIRGYVKGELRSEHHLIEDFASEWKEEVHTMPLEKYFRQEIKYSQAPEQLNFVRS